MYNLTLLCITFSSYRLSIKQNRWEYDELSPFIKLNYHQWPDSQVKLPSLWKPCHFNIWFMASCVKSDLSLIISLDCRILVTDISTLCWFSCFICYFTCCMSLVTQTVGNHFVTHHFIIWEILENWFPLELPW